MKENKKCWICGANANSGEHKIKKATLKDLFENDFRNNEMLHYKDGKYTKVHGMKSKKLKYFVLCEKCNNDDTQVYDLSFDKFRNYVLNNSEEIIKNRSISFSDIYGENHQREQTNLFKYLIKIFGCDLSEKGFNVPRDLVELFKKDIFQTRVRISFTVCIDVIDKDFNSLPAGLGALISSEENIKYKEEHFLKTFYVFSMFFSYIRIHFFYGIPTGDELGTEWIANKRRIYLGRSSYDEERNYNFLFKSNK